MREEIDLLNQIIEEQNIENGGMTQVELQGVVRASITDAVKYIDDEISALIQRLELKNPDVHSGCLRVMVKKHLDYQSVKIFADLIEEYPNAKELRV